jgi:hypothetical protein
MVAPALQRMTLGTQVVDVKREFSRGHVAEDDLAGPVPELELVHREHVGLTTQLDTVLFQCG